MKKVSQDVGVLGYPVVRETLRDARTGQVAFRGAGNAWELRVFWLNLGKPLHPNPVATFEIRGCKSQSENEGLCEGNPQLAGSENLSNLSGYVRVEFGPRRRPSADYPESQMPQDFVTDSPIKMKSLFGMSP